MFDPILAFDDAGLLLLSQIGDRPMTSTKSYYVIFRQGVRVGQAWARDALHAIDLWIDTAADSDRRLLPGPYMAVEETEARDRRII